MAQRVAVDHEVGVVGDVAARRAQMDDARRARRVLAEGVDVRHHVVANLFFARAHHVIVDGADVGGKLVHLRLCDGQPQLMLRLCQTHPQPAPRFKAHIGRKQVQHIL